MWIPSDVVFFTRILIAATLGIGLGASAGCSNRDDAPPVGTVSVTSSESRLPIGSPLELTYRFELTGAPLEDDYTVFAHLIDADGETRWIDDHAPSVPTREWKPGTPVEYTRTRFLPAALLLPGEATIEVGLYRDGERLPLAGPRAPRRPGSRAYPVVDLQLAPESERTFVIYQSGWYQDEFAAEDASRSWKWTQQAATIAFRHPKSDATLLIELGTRPDAFGETPQQITIVGAGNQPITSFSADSAEPVLHRIPLTSAQMGTADLAELRIDVDRTFVPAEVVAGSRDVRSLGVRIYNVFLEKR